MTTSKASIRSEIKSRKARCADKERAALSQAVTSRLTNHPRWHQAQTVLLYHSLPDEVDTHALIRRALSEGKKVLLPVVIRDELELRCLNVEDELHEGAFHIQEPTGERFTNYTAIDLAVVPGVAFTSDGGRLGRGRGFYDRLLPQLKVGPTYTIGLAWPFQMVDELPLEKHDIPLDEVITSNLSSPL
ncbi:MAG: 5-formyltetrahydrofolate cyclo-ligase [Bacteroidales bacterium]|nr:5-formyltetrahydrofolate cyclo-ligase [Bacteroidales bacterium]